LWLILFQRHIAEPTFYIRFFGIRYIFSFIDAVSNFEYIQDNRVTGVSIHQVAASLFSAVIVTEEGHAFTL